MIPLRLVLDTNVIVSAALSPDGLPRTAFLLGITKPARLYVSYNILAEYREVLARRELGIRKGVRQRFLQLVANRAHIVRKVPTIQAARDPEDDKFLECADSARADYLITGNRRHFPRFWKSTKVIIPAELVALVAPHLTS